MTHHRIVEMENGDIVVQHVLPMEFMNSITYGPEDVFRTRKKAEAHLSKINMARENFKSGCKIVNVLHDESKS